MKAIKSIEREKNRNKNTYRDTQAEKRQNITHTKGSKAKAVRCNPDKDERQTRIGRKEGQARGRDGKHDTSGVN